MTPEEHKAIAQSHVPRWRVPMLVVAWRYAPNQWWNPRAWWDLRAYTAWRKTVYGEVPPLREVWRFLRASQKVRVR